MPVEDPTNPLESTIIIHPGSLYLRIGRASDPAPIQLLHAVARRRRPNAGVHCDPFLPPAATSLDSSIAQDIDAARKAASKTLQSCVQSDGRRRYTTGVTQIAAHNRRAVGRPVAKVASDHIKMDGDGEGDDNDDDATEDAPTHRTTTSPSALATAYKPTDNADTLFCDDIPAADPAELAAHYNVHCPMRRGVLNVHAGIGGSLYAVLADLQHIWTHALRHKLAIEPAALAGHRAVLIVPDIYNRWHLRELMTLLLQRIGFGACFLVQDHVAATFGAGMPFACVVDCGDQKTSVSCVEDGVSQAGTRVRLDYGGGDVAQVHRWLQRGAALPAAWTGLRVDSRPADAMAVRRVAEDWCHVDVDRCGPQEKRLRLRTVEDDAGDSPLETEWKLLVGDEAMVAPLALFQTELLAVTEGGDDGSGRRAVWVQSPAAQQPDAEDCFDAEYLRETGRKYTREQLDQTGTPIDATTTTTTTTAQPTTPTSSQTPQTTNATGDQIDIDIVVDGTAPGNESERDGGGGKSSGARSDRDFMLADGQIIGLDQAVVKSIERCGSDELKRKMYATVLVVGGGMRIAGLGKWLQTRLALLTPYQFRGSGGGGVGADVGGSPAAGGGPQTAEVVTVGGPKDGGDPSVTVWRGAAIMAGLESAPELFIEADEWERGGVRILRERALFMW